MCLTPIRIKGKKNENGIIRIQGHAIVPCGKCPKCKLKRANAWIFRLLQEEKVHQNALFVTLTYSNENVPITPKGFMTLVKRDYQLFMKRLRYNTGNKKIKYYACGEYGTTTWRPHYHAIMYDVTHEQIEKAWTLGHIYVGTVTGASIGYTTKYICKDKRVPLHGNDDRIPEFSLMSQRLGKNYITPAKTKWHIENNASYVVVEGGYKQPLPRYYRNFIFNEDQKQKINHLNQLKCQEQFKKDVAKYGSEKEYYRDRFESIRHQLFLGNNTTKRNKI